MIMIDNDAQGCYDRIRMNLNTICARRMGMPKNAAIFHAKSLVGMTHHIRTAHGDSDGGIPPNDSTGGVGQGSGGGPTANHVQLVPLIDTISKLTPGFQIQDPEGFQRLVQWVITWVANIKNKATIPHNDTDLDKIMTAVYIFFQRK